MCSACAAGTAGRGGAAPSCGFHVIPPYTRQSWPSFNINSLDPNQTIQLFHRLHAITIDNKEWGTSERNSHRNSPFQCEQGNNNPLQRTFIRLKFIKVCKIFCCLTWLLVHGVILLPCFPGGAAVIFCSPSSWGICEDCFAVPAGIFCILNVLNLL